MTTKPVTYYPGRTVATILLVLFAMPLGHASMVLMERWVSPQYMLLAGFLLGLAGLAMVLYGVFAKGDAKQTLLGLFGGLLYWSGWVEYFFLYYARRYGTQPEIVDGVVVTKPEYLIMPATFGMFMMTMVLYLFCTRTGCYFITWIQKKLFRDHRRVIVARPMTRHTSIVTFMELNMMMWAMYLLLMFCYDPLILGDHHPVTFIVGLICLVGSILMLRKQLTLKSWGANIRMAIATVIVFWTPVEILGRINLFQEIWVMPEKYIPQMVAIGVVFVAVTLYLILKARRRG